MLDHFQAKREMKKLFNGRFNNYAVFGVPDQDPEFPPLNLTKRGSTDIYVPEVNWRNVEKEDVDDNGVHFLYFALQNVTKRQKSFTGGRKDTVGTTYTTNGYATVEIYFSKSSYQSVDEDRLTTIVERCFTQQNSQGVWFRNALVIDMDAEENHYRSNVLAEYEYDSVIR